MLTQKYLFKDYHHRFQRKRSCENQLVMFVLNVLSRLYGAVNHGHKQTDCIIMFLGSQMCHKEGICYTHNLSYIRFYNSYIRVDLNHVQPTFYMIAFRFSRFIQIRIGSFLLASLSNYQIEILGEAAVLVCLKSSYRNSLCKTECLTQPTPKRHHFSVVY